LKKTVCSMVPNFNGNGLSGECLSISIYA